MPNTTDQHPEKDELLAFGMGKLGPDESEIIADHLDGCSKCSETIVNLQDDTFVSLVRSSPAPTPIDDANQIADVNRTDPAQPDVTIDIASGVTGDESSPAKLPPELREHPRYEILELIGHGGMGDVYKAQHKVMNRMVALKVIKPEMVKNDAAVNRFRREVQAAASLRHPNIVTAHDAEQAGNLHFLVMEYVEGDNLDEVVSRDGRLPVDKACDLIRQAALGLQHAHEQGMVHRDIKPHNLMVEKSRESRDKSQEQEIVGGPSGSGLSTLDPRPSVKILDFGLANFASEVAEDELESAEQTNLQQTAPGVSIMYQLTQMGTMMGTPDYIAPEQAEDAHTADIRSDIYSLGCTFYTLLSGKAPFDEGSVLDKIKAHTQQEAAPLSDTRDDVPAEVEAILNKMMAKDPAERYQTPAEVAEALSAVGWASEPVQDRAKNGFGKPFRRARRPIVLTAVATLFLALIAAATLFYIQTDNGVVRVEVTDPSLKVTIAGQTITASDGEKPLTIRAGEQKLIVRQNDSDFELVTDSFQLRRGDRIALKVDLLPGEVVVSKDGEPFGTESLPSSRASANRVVVEYIVPENQDPPYFKLDGETLKNPPALFNRLRPLVVKDPQLVVQLEGDLNPKNPDYWQLHSLITSTGVTEVELPPGLREEATRIMERNMIDGLAERKEALRKIAVALIKHADATKHYPPNPNLQPEAIAGLSWRVHLLPYLGHGELHRKFNVLEPWDSEHNKALLTEMPDAFKTTDDPTKTTLLMVVGEGTAYEGKHGLEMKDFRDGLSNTAFVVDAGSEKAVPWTKPEDLPFDSEDPIRAFGTSDFGDVFLALMADGSVQSIPYDTAPESLRALFTRAAGDSFDLSAKRTTPLPQSVRPQVRADKLAEIGRFEGHEEMIKSLAVAPDGRYVVSVSRDGSARVWDVAARKEVLRFDGHESVPRSVAISPNGKTVATGDDDGIVFLWDLHSGRTIRRLNGKPESDDGEGQAIASLAFSPDGKQIATGDRRVRLWDVATGEEQWQPSFDTTKRRFIFSLAYSPDGGKLAAGVSTHSVVVWDLQTREKIYSEHTRTSSVTATGWSQDGRLLAVGDRIGNVVIYNPENDMSVALPQLEAKIGNLHFTPDDRHLIISGADRTLRIWDVARQQEVHRHEATTHSVNQSVLLPDGRHLVTGGGGVPKPGESGFQDRGDGDYALRLWQLPQGVWPEEPPVELSLQRTLKGHSGLGMSTASLAATADGRRLITAGGKDKTARLWNTTSGETLFIMPMENDGPVSVAITSDGKLGAVRGTNGHIGLWDLVEKKKLRSLDQTEVRGAAMAFSADGRRLVTGALPAGDHPPLSIVWDVETGQRLHVHRFPFDEPVGAVVAVPGTDDVIFTAKRYWRWNTVSGKLAPLPDWPESLGGDLDISSDGKLAAIVTNETVTLKPVRKKFSVQLRELETGRLVKTLETTEAELSQLAAAEMPTCTCFVAGDQRVAVGYMHGEIRVFEIASGRMVAHKTNILPAPNLVALSDRRIASTGLSREDHGVRIWQLPQSVWPDDAALRTSFSELVALNADGITRKEAARWLEREAPLVAKSLDATITHQALGLLAGLPAASHRRLLRDGYLRWRPDQFDKMRRAVHSEIVHWYVQWAARNNMAGGRKPQELTEWLLGNTDVGFAVVDIPEPDGAMICWCLIAREGLPFPGSFPLIGMPSEVDKARGKELLVAQADRLRELRELPVSPVPEGGWPVAETPTYEALRKQAVALYTFEKDTFYERDDQKYVRDVSGNGHDALIEDDKPAYSPDGKIGGALLCNRTDSTSAPLAKLRLPAAFVSGKYEYTIVMWVQTTAVSDESTSVLYRESIPGKKSATPTLFQLADARLQAFSRGYYVEASTSASEAATPAGSIPRDRWFFLALALKATVKGDMLQITIDDKRWEDDYTQVSNLKDGFGFLGGIDGMVDEVAFFDRALTEQEVETLRKRELPAAAEAASLSGRPGLELKETE